jgi:uncharacterized protein YlbG (UPF0298 family)
LILPISVQYQPTNILYTNTKNIDKTLRKIITFTSLKAYRGINLAKEIKDFYNENFRTLIKEIE